MASNEMHDNCIQTDSKTTFDSQTNQLVQEFSVGADKGLKIMSSFQESIEKSTESGVESVSKLEPIINGQTEDKPVLKTVIEVADESDAEMSGQMTQKMTIESDSVTNWEPKPESSFKWTPKYIRKTSTEMLSKIWVIIDSKEWHKNVDQLNKCLIEEMFNLFNIKLNENKIKQIMETALNDKLVIREESDKGIRYSMVCFGLEVILYLS